MTQHKTVINELAQLIEAREACCENGSGGWALKHLNSILHIQNNLLPHGSGIDGKNEIDLVKSTKDKIVIHTSYHHMNDNGYYDGWTEHTLTITPSFVFGMEIKISGRNRNEIKDYLHEIFYSALSAEYKG